MSKNSPKKNTNKNIVQKKSIMSDELKGAQESLKLTPKKRQALSDKLNNNVYINGTNDFIDKFFTKGSTIGNVLKNISSWVFNAFGIEHGNVNWDNYMKGLEKEAAANDSGNIEEFVVAHQSLGYKGGANSAEAATAAMNGNEKQIEFDVRLGPGGKLYAAHDKIDSKTDKSKLQPMDKMLEAFATHKHQNVTMFIDLKDQGSISPLITKMAEIDLKYKDKENYKPLLQRAFFTSFDPEQLKEVYDTVRAKLNITGTEDNETKMYPPLMFHYYPTANVPNGKEVLKKIGKKNINGVLNIIDKASGNKLNLAKSAQNVDFKLFENSESKTERSKDKDSAIYIADIVPPKHIMKMIKDSNGYLSIPFKLASPKLIKKIKSISGCKVAVFGVETGDESKEALSIGADLIISDKPNIIN